MAAHPSRTLLLCGALLSCSGAERIPSRVTEEAEGNLAVYTSPDVDVAVQIERLTLSIDNAPPIAVRRDGHPLSFGLADGPHTVEFVGAFRRRSSIGGNHVYGAAPQGTTIPSPATQGAMTSSQLFWQRQRISVRARQGCVVFVRVDVIDLGTPDDWSTQPPILEVPWQARCSEEPHAAAAPVTTATTELPAQHVAASPDAEDAATATDDSSAGDATSPSPAP